MFGTARTASRRHGVTLIEVVIAIFVLSVGILGIMSLFPTGARLTREAVDRSIAALAARHALARVYGQINNIKSPKAADEPLSAVPESKRVGTVYAVNQNSLECRVMGNQIPLWPGLNGYYVVMTSGAADGRLYPITSNSDRTLTTTARFNVLSTEKQYEPVRVGDNFAIIGVKSAAPVTRCYPQSFLGGALNPASVPVDPEKNETRAMPVATYGDATQSKDLWRYGYGCILTCPPSEHPDTSRLDVFVYRGFPYRADSAKYADPSAANSIVVGHYVTYIAAGKKQ